MSKSSSAVKKAVVAAVATPLLAAAVIGAEVVLAVNAPRLPDSEPYDLDRTGRPGAKRILWLGDSTAAGVGATSRDQTLPFLVTEATPDENEASIVSRSISGAKVDDVLEDQLGGLSDQRFDRIYISVGANDVTGRTSSAAFRSDYLALLDRLPDADEVVLLGVPDMGSPPRLPIPLRNLAGWRGRQLDEIVEDIAQKKNLRHVDIAEFTGQAFRDRPVKYFAADDFHPNDEGYELWRDAVLASRAD